MQLNFDATKIEPNQGTPKHPTGKFPAIVSEVSTEENKNKDGGYFSVKFTTPSGQIDKNYNLWFSNPTDGQKQAIAIANSQLSALCHATGIFRLGDGRELLNARCMIEVTPQAKNDKYNEVSKVYDANGNEPGKSANVAAANGGNGGWPTQAPTQAPAQPAAAPAAQGWSNPAPAQNNAPAPNPAPANTGWQQGPSAPAGQMPDWARNK